MNVPVLFDDNSEVDEYDEDGYKIIKYHLIGTGMHLRFHIDELMWLDPEGKKRVKDHMREMGRIACDYYGLYDGWKKGW